MSELATTFVRIRPRTTGFKQEADAQLARQKPADQTVQVSADTRRADDHLRVLQGRLDELRLKTATVGVDLNDRAVVAKLAALDAALDRLDRVRANPKVDVDGIARAEAEVEALNLQLDHLDRRVGGGSGSGGVLSTLAAFGGNAAFGRGALMFAGGSALLPFLPAAAGAGASFLTPTVAGGLGLGLFGAASKSAVTRVEDVEKKLTALNQRIANTPATNPAGSAQQIAAAQARLAGARASLAAVQASDTSTPARIASAQAAVASAQNALTKAQGGGVNPAHDKLLAQRQQLLSQLTPAEKAAAKGIEGLEDAWKHFQRAIEPQTFTALASGTDILKKGLHDLLPMTLAVGNAVDDLAKRADKALSDPFWQHFFGDFLTKEAPKAVDTLGTVIGNVVTGFAHLTEDFAPLGHQLEDDLTRWSGIFNQWTQGAGPQRFIALVEQDGPVAAQALVALAHGLTGLFNGLEPLGRLELQALTPILNFIGELGQQHPEVITALGAAYLTVAAGLKAIGAVNSISGKFGGGGVLGGTAARRALGIGAGALGAFTIGQVAPTNTTGRVISVLGGAGAGALAGSSFGPVGTAIGGIAGAAVGLISNFHHLGSNVESAGQKILALSGDLATVIGQDKGRFGGSTRAYVEQYLQGHPALLASLAKQGVGENQIAKYLRTGTFSFATPASSRLASALGGPDAGALFDLRDAYAKAFADYTNLQLLRHPKPPPQQWPGEPPGWHPPMAPQVTTVYDLRGSTFQNVNNPRDLERQLKAKQRQSQLGPGVSLDNVARLTQ